MKIAIEGCAHGELEKIYDTISLIENQEKIKVDLLICCGDFQSTRNEEDLACMACPVNYRQMCSFYKYYSGEKQAPILTLFIGGNHEASSYLQELAYGGWVAPNIYYLGYAGVVNVGGLRIGGISGIQKGRDYLKGHFEKAPYTENTKRSCYHIRNLEVFRLKQLSGKIDIMCSHDWPQGVYHFGNTVQLVKKKPYFKQEIDENQLGSSVCEEVMKELKPTYWFSAHLHVKFSAVIPHPDGSCTKFLALDKCLPKRRFLQILDVANSEPPVLKYDHEWLTVLFLTNHLLSVKSSYNYMPGPNNSQDRYLFTPTLEELDLVSSKFGSDFTVPLNFIPTAPAYIPNKKLNRNAPQAHSKVHPNTRAFCETLCIDDPLALLLAQSTPSLNDSYSSFQSTTPSGLSTPCRANSIAVGGSLRKFKLELPSPKNSSELDESTHADETSSVVVNESTISVGDSTISIAESTDVEIDDTKLLAGVKKFKPYRSKMATNNGNESSDVMFIESPAASELPMPAFDKSALSFADSPVSVKTVNSEFDNSLKTENSEFDSSPVSVTKLSTSAFEDSPLGVLSEPVFTESPMTKPAFSDSPVEGMGAVKDKELEESAKPVAKKFKRRNQSIYQTQDD